MRYPWEKEEKSRVLVYTDWITIARIFFFFTCRIVWGFYRNQFERTREVFPFFNIIFPAPKRIETAGSLCNTLPGDWSPLTDSRYPSQQASISHQEPVVVDHNPASICLIGKSVAMWTSLFSLCDDAQWIQIGAGVWPSSFARVVPQVDVDEHIISAVIHAQVTWPSRSKFVLFRNRNPTC
jgi:hypothetical protein